LVRTDAVVNFNWAGAAPDPSISATNFCVCWTGCVQPQYAETYVFYTFSDAGARLWINGQLLIDAWSNQPPTQWSATIPMLAQQIYNIQMDYYYQKHGRFDGAIVLEQSLHALFHHSPIPALPCSPKPAARRGDEFARQRRRADRRRQRHSGRGGGGAIQRRRPGCFLYQRPMVRNGHQPALRFDCHRPAGRRLRFDGGGLGYHRIERHLRAGQHHG